MKLKYLLTVIVILSAIFVGCSKKNVPAKETAKKETKGSSAAPTKKTPVPKMIVVNDSVAKRTVEGRYYYDLNGKRYYRNNKDGKYYLFNKSMYSNPDFNPQP